MVVFQKSFILFLFLIYCQNAHAQDNETTIEPTTTEIPTPPCGPSCTFKPDTLTPSNLKQWPKNCSTVCASLYIGSETDVSESQLTSAFQNMKTLSGSLTVHRSKFTSMKFLAGLENVKCDDSVFMVILNSKMTELGLTNLTSVACRISITSNDKMVRLNVPNLKTIIPTSPNRTFMDMNIEFLSSDFCITIQEMNNFLENMNVPLNYLPGKYCEVDTTSNSTDVKVCSAEGSLSQLDSGCVQVKGDVRVESGDEEHVEKLETVKGIFGSLIIDGTNLTDIDFLDELEYVAALKEDNAAIQIHHNPQLSNVSFPSLKRVRSDTQFSIVFLNNSEKLLTTPSVCYSIRESLNSENNHYSPTFDGENCEWIEVNSKLQDKNDNFSMTRCSIIFWIMVVSLLITL